MKLPTGKEVLKALEINNQNGWIIAGGSVANTVINLMFGEKLPINDIDVYKILHLDIDDRLEQLGVDEYSGIDDFWIRSREHKGRFDCIHYGTIHVGNKKDLALQMIRSFDLNCVQAAVVDGELLTTGFFRRFLNSREITENIQCRNHVASLARIIRKANDGVGTMNPRLNWTSYRVGFNESLTPEYRNFWSRYREEFFELYCRVFADEFWREFNDKEITGRGEVKKANKATRRNY